MALTDEEKKLSHPVAKWDVIREWQFSEAINVGLKPHHKFLDVGCGSLALGEWVIDYLDTGNYTGIDVRGEVIEVAEKVVLEAGLEVKNPGLYEESVASNILAPEFDFVWAFSVLHYVPNDELEGVIHGMVMPLAEGGQLFANALCGKPYNVNVNNWQGFPTMRRSYWQYKQMLEDLGLWVENKGEVPGLPGEVWMRAYAP